MALPATAAAPIAQAAVKITLLLTDITHSLVRSATVAPLWNGFAGGEAKQPRAVAKAI
jgi:hypothetical protein